MTAPAASDDTPAEVRALHATATRLQTPCGDGTLAWRRWGDGPRELVLLHGGAGSWLHWTRNIPELARHFRVWAPDLPGMGDSDLPPEPWTPDSIAEILDTGLATLLGRPARVALLGFSFGGMVAGHWAAMRPARIERIAVAAPAGNGLTQPPLHAMRSWRKVPDAAERRELHRHNLRAWMLHDPAAADDLAAWIAQQAVERDRLRNREVSTTDSLIRAMARVQCPAHALCGAEDVLYQDCQPQLEQLLAQAGFGRLAWLPRAGHWACFEQPQAFNAWALGVLGTEAATPETQASAAAAG